MILKYDSQTDELLARGGSFDISGTDAVEDKQFWGFNASEGTIIASIKGVANNVSAGYADLAAIRADEVDISALVVTSLAAGLLGGVIYRVDGYIITSVDLTSGALHCYKTTSQISA